MHSRGRPWPTGGPRNPVMYRYAFAIALVLFLLRIAAFPSSAPLLAPGASSALSLPQESAPLSPLTVPYAPTQPRPPLADLRCPTIAPPSPSMPVPPTPSTSSAPRGGRPGAALQFLRYEPSMWEAQWQQNAASWGQNPCAKLAERDQMALLQSWTDLGVSFSSNYSRLADGTSVLDRDAFGLASRMVFVTAGGEERSYGIHPLAGIVRDARLICPNLTPDVLSPAHSDFTSAIISKDFLVFDPAYYAAMRDSLVAVPTRRAYLFDLGATVWGDNWNGIKWLVGTYAAAGIVFDEIFAWEAKAMENAAFFDGMPADVVGRTHFYNMPVSNVPGSATNPLTILSRLNADDFIVFKLDIDAPALEEDFVATIQADGRLSARIDEFYFEHHVGGGHPMDSCCWGGNVRGNLNTSIELFQRLREKGVRANSWP